MKKRHSHIYLNAGLNISLAIVIVLGLLSGVTFAIVEKECLVTLRNNNEVLLSEIGNHLTYMHNVNAATCQTQFNDPDIKALLTNTKETNALDVLGVMRRIHKFVISNGMVHSVLLYNGAKDEYYSTQPLGAPQNKEIAEFLRGNTEYKTFLTYPRRLVNETGDSVKDVLSYICISRTRDNRVEYAVVVDVRTDWLLQNLSNEEPDQNQLFLVDAQGNIILGNNDKWETAQQIAQVLLQKEEDTIEAQSFPLQTVEGKRVISYRKVSGTDWYLINDQPYAELFELVETIKSKMLIAVAAAMLFGLVVSFGLAHILNKPIEKLISHVRAKLPDESVENSKREIEFLLEVFEEQDKKIRDFQYDQDNYTRIMRKNRIKTALLDNSTGVQLYEKTTQAKQAEVFVENEQLYMALAVLNSFSEVSIDDVEQRSVLRFVLCNIAEEVLQPYGHTEVLPVHNNEVVLLCNVKEIHDETSYCQLLQQICVHVENVIHFPVTMLYIPIQYTEAQLGQAYRHLRQMTGYTLIYGTGLVLSARELTLRAENGIDYPCALEQAVLTAMAQADATGAKKNMEQILNTIEQGSIQSYMIAVQKLAVAIQRDIEQINTNRVVKIQVQIDVLNARIKTAETRQQMIEAFAEVIDAVCSQIYTSAARKNDIIVQKVEKYIEEHFEEQDLCAKQIAFSFDLSVKYLGALFKENKGCSLQEFINQVKLEHAQQMILETNMLIGEVSERCGFEPSTFYRLYRQRFGVSPKEQRLQKRLQETTNEDNV